MPSTPLRSSLHVDQLLSNIAVKYENKNFVHDKLFPAVAVKKQSDLYRTYDRNWVIPDTSRAMGGLAKEHVFGVGTASYNLQNEALKSYIPDAAQENYDITDLKADVTMDLVEKVNMKMEQDCAAHFQTTTSWSLNASLAGDEFWVTTTSKPIADFDTAASAILGNSGQNPNIALVPQNVYVALKNNSSIADRVKYTSKEMTPAIISGLLGVDELLVASARYDSGLYGASAASGAISNIWGTNFAWLGTRPASPGFYALSSGYRFHRPKPMIKSWRDEEREATAVEVGAEYQFKIVASLSGYLINAVLS
jgi:hypothetical protein